MSPEQEWLGDYPFEMAPFEMGPSPLVFGGVYVSDSPWVRIPILAILAVQEESILRT